MNLFTFWILFEIIRGISLITNICTEKFGRKEKTMIMYDEWKSRRAEESSHFVMKNRFEMNSYGKLFFRWKKRWKNKIKQNKTLKKEKKIENK